jgi:hypothetical protein
MDPKLDDEHLVRVLGATKPHSDKPVPELSSRLQNLKLAVEMIALIAAGVWAVLIYLTFQRVPNQLSKEQATQQLEARIIVAPKIEIRRLRSLDNDDGVYEVKYTYAISSASARRTTVAVVALEWFIGSLGQDPPHFFRENLPMTQGPIRWDSRGVEVHSRPGTDKNIMQRLIGDRTDRSREVVALEDSKGGAGEYAPGETETNERTFFVTARPERWVGFYLQIIMRKKGGGLERYYSQKCESLAVVTPPEKNPRT